MNVQTMPTTLTAPRLVRSAEPAPAGESPVPPLDAVSTEAPQSTPEPGLGQRLKKAFFHQQREGNKVISSPFNKVMFGAVCASGAWTACKIAADLAAAPTVGAAVGKVAMDVAGLGVGYMAADVVSGMLHHWADNYADPNSGNAFVRKFAKQAQRHHYHPTGLADYSVSGWAAPLSTVSWAPLVAANLLNLPAPVLAGTLSMVAGTSIYGVFHMYSHKPEKATPGYIKLLQKTGLAISRKDHAKHHSLPWNSDFCIVSGQMNKVFDKIGFWPKYEKAIFKLTGKAPESWNIPEYKDFVDGKISKEEYISRAKEIRKHFMETEYHQRKEKWGVD